MSCYADSGYREDEINGECPICGEPTVDEEAFNVCTYSPVICQECGNAPCDGSC